MLSHQKSFSCVGKFMKRTIFFSFLKKKLSREKFKNFSRFFFILFTISFIYSGLKTSAALLTNALCSLSHFWEMIKFSLSFFLILSFVVLIMRIWVNTPERKKNSKTLTTQIWPKKSIFKCQKCRYWHRKVKKVKRNMKIMNNFV